MSLTILKKSILKRMKIIKVSPGLTRNMRHMAHVPSPIRTADPTEVLSIR